MVVNLLRNQVVSLTGLCTYSSLKLFELFFNQEDSGATQSESEFELNLFKAYLILNSEFTNVQKIAGHSTIGLGANMRLPAWLFSMDYPTCDKANYDITQVWISQIIKAIYLFEFLSSHEKTKTLIEAFLIEFHCETWKDYLKKLIPLSDSIVRQEKEGHIDIFITPGENYVESIYFLEKLIVGNNEDLIPNDFLTLRTKPFYKIKDGLYRIVFNLFVVEKIFKGAYFLLRDVNDKLKPGDGRIAEFRSFYGSEFSEKNICYRVIESIYPKVTKHFSGKELSDMRIDGAPDYYIRKGKNILLIESKDFLIPVEKKMSFDFKIYEEEFRRALYYKERDDGKISNKAVMQLAASIEKLLCKKFKADTDYSYREVSIYPILLTHDSQYEVPGFNEIIDCWFQQELLKLEKKGLFIHRVYPITIINVDTLIYNQWGFCEMISLHEAITLYHDFKNVKSNLRFNDNKEFHKFLFSKMIPFSVFIDRYFVSKGWSKLPPFLELVGPALFGEEYQHTAGQ